MSFVFNGLEVGKPMPDLPARDRSARALEQAWDFYDQQQADQVVDAFSNAGMIIAPEEERGGSISGGIC